MSHQKSSNSSNNSSNNQKFRPYFTPSELLEIISALKEQNKNRNLIRYLEGFAIKIERGVLEPQLTLNPAPSIEQKLGFHEDHSNDSLGNLLAKKKLASYSKWKLFPASCSPNELAQAKMYRYENDLMDSQEEFEYETLHFGTQL